ncbi:Uu.00g109110.m01.CDS01 [Anthostomella pinea]|uniref:Uu.00g109110.m01.CDS01 n=1 Tax=Anthostomella pinea TaxID=933095 RepID=A0AAI8VFP4_9PEZI|nr:Uu.00g109110.m01.CDS01 [Anthostomella pinea]
MRATSTITILSALATAARGMPQIHDASDESLRPRDDLSEKYDLGTVFKRQDREDRVKTGQGCEWKWCFDRRRLRRQNRNPLEVGYIQMGRIRSLVQDLPQGVVLDQGARFRVRVWLIECLRGGGRA